MNSLFNSNDYKRGFNIGYDDGFNKKNKQFYKSGLSLKFAIHGSTAIDTYNQGYNEGYEKGSYDRLSKDKPQKVIIETKQTVQSNNFQTTKNNSLMGTQQYRLQQEKLQELAQFLASFNYDIQSKLNEYKQRVQYMYETGLPEETKLRFEMEHIMETESLVNTISNLIEERSIPFTNQNIELMENLIALNS
jgi:hypothetical protein